MSSQRIAGLIMLFIIIYIWIADYFNLCYEMIGLPFILFFSFILGWMCLGALTTLIEVVRPEQKEKKDE